VLEPRFGWGELPEQGVVVVSGPPAYVRLIEATLAALPSAPGGQQVRVFRLKHAAVDDRIINYRDREITTPGVANILRNLVLGLYFLPFITSTVALSLVFTSMFSKDFGIVNTALGHVLGLAPIDWNQPEYTKIMISLVVFWRYVGWNTVLYLSALQTVPRDLLEAAALDGARPWQQFVHVVLPLLKPMAYFAVTLTLIGNLQLFEEPFILTGGTGGIDQGGRTAAMHMYRVAFTEGDFGTASAIAWLLFAVMALATWGNNRLLGERKGSR
jgi:multiple sugar transport system permease protein